MMSTLPLMISQISILGDNRECINLVENPLSPRTPDFLRLSERCISCGDFNQGEYELIRYFSLNNKRHVTSKEKALKLQLGSQPHQHRY